jgi:hypothetical protein
VETQRILIKVKPLGDLLLGRGYDGLAVSVAFPEYAAAIVAEPLGHRTREGASCDRTASFSPG